MSLVTNDPRLCLIKRVDEYLNRKCLPCDALFSPPARQLVLIHLVFINPHPTHRIFVSRVMNSHSISRGKNDLDMLKHTYSSTSVGAIPKAGLGKWRGIRGRDNTNITERFWSVCLGRRYSQSIEICRSHPCSTSSLRLVLITNYQIFGRVASMTKNELGNPITP